MPPRFVFELHDPPVYGPGVSADSGIGAVGPSGAMLTPVAPDLTRELPPDDQTEKIELLSAALDRPVVLAYGRHIVGGNVVFEHENPDGTVALLLALGEGEWDGPERVWVNGLELNLADTTQFHFHPGLEGENGRESTPSTRNQKICSFFPADFAPQLTFSRTAYAAFQLRRDPTAPGPEFDIRGIYRTARVRQFDLAGNQTAYAYSSNPAWKSKMVGYTDLWTSGGREIFRVV